MYVSVDFSLIIFLMALLMGLLTLFVFRKKQFIRIYVWLVLLNLIIQFLIQKFLWNKMYKEIIDKNCLFGIDRYDCGGSLASIYKLIGQA